MSAVRLGGGIHIYMRTLLDLLDSERGYVRIYEECEGFGYELSTYVRQPIADLFERMNGYASIGAAREAARYQLSAAAQVKRLRRKPLQRRAPAARRSATAAVLHASDAEDSFNTCRPLAFCRACHDSHAHRSNLCAP